MQTQPANQEQAAMIGQALNQALADSGLQIFWSPARQCWGYLIQTAPNKREFIPCTDLPTAIAKCAGIYARRKGAIEQDRAFISDIPHSLPEL